jgi:hypothetical protein
MITLTTRRARRLIAGLALIAATAGAAGLRADAARADIVKEAESQSAPFDCGTNTHGQSGGLPPSTYDPGHGDARCVQMTTAPIAWADTWSDVTAGRTGWYCPRDYPYVYGGSFSANPWWLDRSTFPGWLVVRMLAQYDGLPNKRAVSYAGNGPDSRGFVLFWIGGIGTGWRQADYMCTDTPWKP